MAKQRHFRLISYLEEEQIKIVLDKHDVQIKAYAYILHDKDILENGEPKPKHYHILLSLHNGNNVSTVINWFYGFIDDKGLEINTLGQIMNNRQGALLYLTHNTPASSHKYQYPKENIKSFNIDFFELPDTEQDNISSALEDMINQVPLRQIALKYGRDFIIHYSHIKALYIDIMQMTGGVIDD